MKFQIERHNLLSGVQQVVGVVERRNTMPILSHLLISATLQKGEEQEGNVSLFATDMEMGIRDHYPAQVTLSGQITLPARKLLEIVRELPEGMVKITQQENHWISIESGNAIFKIAGLPPDEFPSFSQPGEEENAKTEIDPEILSRLIQKTVFAVGENDPRYILNGLLIQMRRVTEAKSVIRLVATDGNRLALAEEVIKRPASWPMEESVILPKKAILEIKRLIDDTWAKEKGEKKSEPTMALGKGVLTFQYGTATLSARLLQGNYPNYQQVIPKENHQKVSANKTAILGAIGRVSILANEKTSIIKVSIEKGQIVFKSNSPEMGEAIEIVATSFDGEPFTILFSASYLRDILLSLDDEEVVFEFKNAESACLIQEKSGRFLSILMPLRDD
jgi:DNA polymerase-3 subunit beta